MWHEENIMWIYFVEQMWDYDSNNWNRLNFHTRELSSSYWDQYHSKKEVQSYPTSNMILGVDYVEY